MSGCCNSAEFLGRKTQSLFINKNDELDISLAISIHMELESNTPVVVGSKRLTSEGDTYCDESNWPYLVGEKLPIVFEQLEDNRLRVTIQKLVPNPNYREVIHEPKQ